MLKILIGKDKSKYIIIIFVSINQYDYWFKAVFIVIIKLLEPVIFMPKCVVIIMKSFKLSKGDNQKL